MELAINKLYVNFEKKLFVCLSIMTFIVCILLCKQYFTFLTEIEKMRLVRQEYHHSLEMLKKIIQEKNCDAITDDLDSLEDKIDEDKAVESQSSLDTLGDVDLAITEEDILDEQDEDAHKFQFISAEDEKQLKDLRKETRQVVLARKKVKSKRVSQQNLSTKQIAQLQKNSSERIVQDFTFHWPLELHHFWLSSLFGARKKANGKPGFHYGIDMAAIRGTPVKAAAAGTVIQAQYVPGYGNNILIQHNKYYRTRYAHLQRIHVVQGQKVTQGQKIGTVGDTGSVRKSGRDASHLHFEIYHNGSHVNPLRYLFN